MTKNFFKNPSLEQQFRKELKGADIKKYDPKESISKHNDELKSKPHGRSPVPNISRTNYMNKQTKSSDAIGKNVSKSEIAMKTDDVVFMKGTSLNKSITAKSPTVCIPVEGKELDNDLNAQCNINDQVEGEHSESGEMKLSTKPAILPSVKTTKSVRLEARERPSKKEVQLPKKMHYKKIKESVNHRDKSSEPQDIGFVSTPLLSSHSSSGSDIITKIHFGEALHQTPEMGTFSTLNGQFESLDKEFYNIIGSMEASRENEKRNSLNEDDLGIDKIAETSTTVNLPTKTDIIIDSAEKASSVVFGDVNNNTYILTTSSPDVVIGYAEDIAGHPILTASKKDEALESCIADTMSTLTYQRGSPDRRVRHIFFRPQLDELTIEGVTRDGPRGEVTEEGVRAMRVAHAQTIAKHSRRESEQSEFDIEKALEIMNISTSVSHEDIVNVSGKRVQLNPAKIAPNPAERFGTEHRHQPREKSKNIHHFCATSSVQADMSPDMRMKARFSHTPARFASLRTIPLAGEDEYDEDTEMSSSPPPTLHSIYDEMMFEEGTECEEDEEDKRLHDIAEKILNEIEEESPALTEKQTTEKQTKKFMKLQNVVDQMFEKSPAEDISIEGVHIPLVTDQLPLYWMHAPPKLAVPPAVIKETVLPAYEGAVLNADDVLMPGELDAVVTEQQTDALEEESKEEVEFRERLITREHHSAMELRWEDEDDDIDREGVKCISDAESDEGDERPEEETKENHGRFETILEMRRKLLKSRPESECSSRVDEQKQKQDWSPVRAHSQPELMFDSHSAHSLGSATTLNVSYEATMNEVREQTERMAALTREVSGDVAMQVQPLPHPDSAVRMKQEEERKRKMAANKKSKKGTIRYISKALVQQLLVDLSTNRQATIESRACSMESLSVDDKSVAFAQRSESVPDLTVQAFHEKIGSKFIGPKRALSDWIKEEYWYKWFDELYPPPSNYGDDNDFEDDGSSDSATKQENESEQLELADISLMHAPVNEGGTSSFIRTIDAEIAKLTTIVDAMSTDSKSSSMLGFHLCRRGACFKKKDELCLALNDLNRAIEVEPGLLDSYWHRHLVFLVEGNTTKALADLNYIIRRNPRHVNALQSHANILFQKGDLTGAVNSFGDAIRAQPNNAVLYYKRASVLEAKEEILLALNDYRQATVLQPANTNGIRKIGFYHFQVGSWAASVADFTELLVQESADAEAYLYRGMAQRRLHNCAQAIHDLSIAINLSATNYLPFYERACLLRKASQKQALQDLSISLLLDCSIDNVLSFLHRGILYTEMNRFDEAAKDFEAAIRLVPTLSIAQVNLGLIEMLHRKDAISAVRRFDIAIRMDPTYIKAFVCRAEAHERSHNIAAAVKDYTRAIHASPHEVDYRMARGRLLLQKGSHELSSLHIRQCAAMSHERNMLPVQQAAVLTFLGHFSQAIQLLETATKSQPVAPLFTLLGKVKMRAGLQEEAVESLLHSLKILRPWDMKVGWPFEASEVFYLVALCHMHLKKHLPALDALNNALRINPEYSEAYFQRGLCKIKLQVTKGVHDFNRALVWNPKFYLAYIGRASFYGTRKRFAKAIMNCNEAIKLEPTSVRAYLYRGALKYHIKAYKFAVKDLSKAIAIDTKCYIGFFNRAVCYHVMRHYFKAIKDYSVVLMSDSDFHMKALINRGLLYFEIGDKSNALHDFLLACKSEPSNPNIHHTLGLCYHRLGELEKAIEAYTNALLIDPFFSDALLGRGNVLMDYKNSVGTKLGSRDYLRTLHMNPMALQARVNLAYNMQVQGHFKCAWNLFTRTIEINEGYRPALEGRAIVNLQMGNLFGASVDIGRALKVEQTSEILTNRGVINQLMGDKINAIKDYQAALKLDPSYSLAYYNAANVYFSHRQYTQALSYYDKAIGWNDQDESAYTNRGIAKIMLNMKESALEDFQQAVEMSPFYAHIYYNRGNLLALNQMYTQADADFTQALLCKPGDALVYKCRADVRGKMGRREAALKDYRKAINVQTASKRNRKKNAT